MPPVRRISLLLVDDHPVMRAGLANLLASEKDFLVVGQADDGEAALALWPKLSPDICLLDVTMRGLDGIETLRHLRGVDRNAKVLMLTSSDSAADMARALTAGANGYLTKNVGHEELFAAIREVARGGTPVSRDKIVDGSLPAALAVPLTPRETEVLGLLREGFSNAEIARQLGISAHTAKAHVAAIIEKFGVTDRTQAVARGFDLGLLSARREPAPRR